MTPMAQSGHDSHTVVERRGGDSPDSSTDRRQGVAVADPRSEHRFISDWSDGSVTVEAGEAGWLLDDLTDGVRRLADGTIGRVAILPEGDEDWMAVSVRVPARSVVTVTRPATDASSQPG
jgi:hypothetical protein